MTAGSTSNVRCRVFMLVSRRLLYTYSFYVYKVTYNTRNRIVNLTIGEVVLIMTYLRDGATPCVYLITLSSHNRIREYGPSVSGSSRTFNP